MKAHLETLREGYKWLMELMPHELHTPSAEQRANWEAKQERAAKLADAYGFDGILFRDYLLETFEDDPQSLPNLRQLAKQIQTIPRIIAKIEEAKEGEKARDEDIGLIDTEEAVLAVVARNKGQCLDQMTIAAQARIPKKEPRGSVRPHLRSLQKKSLIHRPDGNTRRTITASVLFLAALLTTLQILFGWMGGIWRFLTGK